MSEIITLKASASALISDGDGYKDRNNHSAKTIDFGNPATQTMLSKFVAPSESYFYREVLGATIRHYVDVNFTMGSSRTAYVYALKIPFDPSTVTGRSYSAYDRQSAMHTHLISRPGFTGWIEIDTDSIYEIEYLLENGVELRVYAATEYDPDDSTASTAYGSNPPELVVVFGDPVSIPIWFTSPLAGESLNPNADCRFVVYFPSDYLRADANTIKPIELAAGELQWKLKGSAEINRIALSAADLQISTSTRTIDTTVPGGTFPTGNIEYRFMLTANSGAITYSEWTALVTPTAVVSSYSPASGARLNRLHSNYFSCLIKASPEGNSKYLNGQSGSVLRWRLAGGAINEVALIAPHYTAAFVDGGTFPGGSIEYQLSVIDELGRTVETPWVTISTVDTVSKARAISPQGTVEDGERPITLRWAHINESGAPATRSEIQAARLGEAMAALATVEGSATENSVPARTFASGEWRWRVRTYNLDGVAGDWSQEADFVVIASPATPILVLENSGPRPVIRWQTAEQEGYELELDGVSLGTSFGTEQSWRSPEYLSDGSHSLRVRVQNVYGLWSDWGSLLFLVANTPGPAITLQGSGSREARLVWAGTGYDFYVVYRDGVAVAKLSENQWIDYYAIDTVRYQIRGCYRDRDDYGLSNEIALELLPDTILVAAMSDLGAGGWLALPLSQSQYRSTKTSLGRQVNLLQLAGSRYPTAEPEEHYSKSISVSCAFSKRQDCRQLEALAGRLVCLKTPCGEMAIGYLQTLSKSGQEFFSTYSFSVQHLETEEAIDLDA